MKADLLMLQAIFVASGILAMWLLRRAALLLRPMRRKTEHSAETSDAGGGGAPSDPAAH